MATRLRAWIVRRRVHAVDEMLIHATSAAEAKRKAKKGDYLWTERLPGSDRPAGFESVCRYPAEDPEGGSDHVE